jgi:hypothetical protein
MLVTIFAFFVQPLGSQYFLCTKSFVIFAVIFTKFENANIRFNFNSLTAERKVKAFLGAAWLIFLYLCTVP